MYVDRMEFDDLIGGENERRGRLQGKGSANVPAYRRSISLVTYDS